jgi:hypothetical protein
MGIEDSPANAAVRGWLRARADCHCRPAAVLPAAGDFDHTVAQLHQLQVNAAETLGANISGNGLSAPDRSVLIFYS